jgi:hypothetical protein
VSELEKYESFMQTQPLTFPRILNPLGESERLPMVLTHFNAAEGYISQEGLWFDYYTTNRQRILEFGANALPAIMARVYRAYPSLVRERHALELLRSAEAFDWVLTDTKMDAAGVDFLVVYRTRAFGVHAYLATERGKAFREAKRTRHKDIGVVIDMPLDPATAHAVGKFQVYGPTHLENLIREIKEYENG